MVVHRGSLGSLGRSHRTFGQSGYFFFIFLTDHLTWKATDDTFAEWTLNAPCWYLYRPASVKQRTRAHIHLDHLSLPCPDRDQAKETRLENHAPSISPPSLHRLRGWLSPKLQSPNTSHQSAVLLKLAGCVGVDLYLSYQQSAISERPSIPLHLLRLRGWVAREDFSESLICIPLRFET